MSAILKVFSERTRDHHQSLWLILDCQHWYHWTGKEQPNVFLDLPCPNCQPVTVAEPMESPHE